MHPERQVVVQEEAKVVVSAIPCRAAQHRLKESRRLRFILINDAANPVELEQSG